MRRSLGIAGPIDLTLGEPPQLQPVVLADDLTRPGCASDFRGRRFSLTFEVGPIIAAAFGGWGTMTDAPNGVVLDSFDVTVNADVVADIVLIGVFLLAPSQLGAHPFPLNAFRAGWFTDPNDSPSAVAPMLAGQNNLLAVTGQRIQQFGIRGDGGTPWLNVPLGVWLPFNGALMIGNYGAPASPFRMQGNVRGRVF
jgi:hypothetical protein